MPHHLPAPHGGQLVNRVLPPDEALKRLEDARDLPRIEVGPDRVRDVVNVAVGRLSPLAGFMREADYARVLSVGRLASGLPWTIPVVLDVPEDSPAASGDVQEVALVPRGESEPVAVMSVRERYAWDRTTHALAVYGTDSPEHPGVARLRGMGDVLLGGPVDLVRAPTLPFRSVSVTPAESRALFEARGWRTVVGYQTRNPPHRGHEAVLKVALSLADGLFVHPVVGRKKPGDFRDDVVMDAYRALVDSYLPADRVVVGALPYEMHYAGPREAVHHAIVRKNHGCTHFVVGRDHAGVAGFYGPEDAMGAFDAFPDLGIEPLFVHGSHAWCAECGGVESERTCRHARADGAVSGTRVREWLRAGVDAPPEAVRPEVWQAIRKHGRPFVDAEESP